MSDSQTIDLPIHRRAEHAVLFAALVACLAEGAVSAAGVFSFGGGIIDAAIGLAAGFGAGAAVLLPLSFLADWVASRSSSLHLWRGIRLALGGRDGNVGVALMSIVLVLGACTAASLFLGEVFFKQMTPRFAATLISLVWMSTFILAFTAVRFFGIGAGLLLRALENRRPRLAGSALSLILLAMTAAAFSLTAALLPMEWVFAPSFALLGFCLYSIGPIRGRFSAFLSRRVVRVAFFVLPFLCVGLLFKDMLPPAVRSSLVNRAPYVGSLLGLGQSLWDRDHDGYSPIFFGGDCDDGAPRLHPGAQDIPSNGIDEDCSGIDAVVYRPQKPPSYTRPKSISDKTNIVFILLDAMRPDHLQFNGYERKTAPVLEQFAQKSLHFKNAYTPCPRTESALISLFTGQDPRVPPSSEPSSNVVELKEKALTLAERLRDRGYDTVGFTISFIIHHQTGIDQGFRIWRTPWNPEDWRKVFEDAADRTNQAVLDYLKGVPEDGSKPFFLTAHYQCTHDPYVKHKLWDFGDRDIDRYDSALSYCDDRTGRVLAALEKRDDRDNTAVVIFSDHGEMLSDHGFKGHGNSLYEPDVRVFLAAKFPGVSPKKVETPVILTDIGATALDLAGISANGAFGLSLLAHIAPKRPLPKRPLFMYTDLRRGSIKRAGSAVLDYPFKLIRDKKAKTVELYDVKGDPEETDNLAYRDGRALQALSEKLESYEAFVASERKAKRR